MFSSEAFSGYSVHNLEESRQFYEDVLSLPVEDSGMGLQIFFDNGHTIFLYEKDDHEPATFTVLNFPVQDIEEAVGQLTENGLEFEFYDDLPFEQDELGILRGKKSGYGPDIAWFKDPSGNILSILET